MFFLEHLGMWLFWSATCPDFIAVPQRASCVLFIFYLPHFFFWNQQMSRGMNLHDGFYVRQSSFELEDVFFWEMLLSLCLLFCQF